MKKLLLLTGGLSLSACATLFSNTNQPIQIATKLNDLDLDNAICKIEVKSKPTQNMSTPGTVMLPRSNKPVIINCLSIDKKYAGTLIIDSNYNTTNLWNIGLLFPYIFPAGVGFVVDKISGADFEYPKLVQIKMTPIESSVPIEFGTLIDSNIPVESGIPVESSIWE